MAIRGGLGGIHCGGAGLGAAHVGSAPLSKQWTVIGGGNNSIKDATGWTWTLRDSGLDPNIWDYTLVGAAYGSAHGVFVVQGDQCALAYSSDQGTTWHTLLAPDASTFRFPNCSLAYDPIHDKFVASVTNAQGGTSYEIWQISGDGTQFTQLTADKKFLSLAAGAGVVLGTDDSGNIWTSSDAGATWTQVTTAPQLVTGRLLFDGTRFVVASQVLPSGKIGIATSADVDTWTSLVLEDDIDSTINQASYLVTDDTAYLLATNLNGGAPFNVSLSSVLPWDGSVIYGSSTDSWVTLGGGIGRLIRVFSGPAPEEVATGQVSTDHGSTWCSPMLLFDNWGPSCFAKGASGFIAVGWPLAIATYGPA